MRRGGFLLHSLWVSALLAACTEDARPSPLEQCHSEAKGECCEDDACDAGSLCDFDYICSPAPGGGLNCSEPGGDRMCHAQCEASAEGAACPGGGTCTMSSRAAGGDNLMDLWLCL